MTSVPLLKSNPPSLGVTDILKEVPEYIAFKSVLVYSASIILLPILAFFTSKILVFDGILSLGVVPSNVCSAICAVVVLHITLGAFIYKAYSDSDKAAKKD